MVLDGYILGIVGPVSDTLSDDLQISALTEGLVVAAALVGIFVGGPLGGWLADRVGRKPLFTFDIALFTVASFLQLFAESAVLLIAIRLLMGLAIGIEYAVGWPLMSEFAPAKLRGRLLGAMSIGFYGGFMIAFTIGYFLSEYVRLDWHLILGTSTVLSVALLIARIGMPESPRWLWSKGRQDEARAIAHRYLDDDALFDIEQEHVKKGNFRELFSRRYWRATLFTSMFWFCAVTPYFAIATFADSVLAQYGLSGGLAGGVGLSAVAVAGVVASVVLIDKVGRRVLTVPPQWIGAAVLAVIALWAGAPPIAILTLFLVFSFVNALYTTLTGVYPGEVLPTEIRGAGTGFAAAISRIGAAIGTFLLPVSMETLGASVTMLSAAGVAVLGAALSQWLAPETRGKSLTEAAESFAH
ncbi:MFS transporter [Pseudonocardia sp. C8]|nr:MFS transporter [Pseudonocardia sp. C8]MBC3193398.1 MFS transporter [Pseudonocardia sp. C8]